MKSRSTFWFSACAASLALTLVSCKTSDSGSQLREDAPTPPPTIDPATTGNRELIENCKALANHYTKALELSPGVTYLRFMKDKVKPMIDDVATNGYDLTDGTGVELAYKCSVQKVKGKIDKVGLDLYKQLGDGIPTRRVTLNNVSQKIKSFSQTVDPFDAANFLGFASGGGVLIKYNETNYSLNVHYDVANLQSGRSYGVGPQKGANDASDREYLDELEHYTRASGDNIPAFYRTIFNSLITSDASGYPQVNDEGQGVLSDFLAIYTAEEARNLMQTGQIRPYWDAALLEVTLLAAFHAGQSQVGLYYFDLHTKKDSFTTKTFKQKSCALSSSTKKASLNDYWQFSRVWQSGSTSSCTRSGINLTKKEFRSLGQTITQWMRANQPDTFNALASAMEIKPTQINDSLNLYFELSKMLISQRGLDTFDNAAALSDAWVNFIGQSTTHANDITASLLGTAATVATPAVVAPETAPEAAPTAAPAALPAVPAEAATPDPVQGHDAATQPAGG